MDNSLGIFSGNGQWRLSNGCRSALAGHSPPNSLGYAQFATCDYDVGPGSANGGRATSPVINLTGISSPIALNMNYFLGTEAFCNFDRAEVRVSNNGFATWTVVASNCTGGSILVDGSGIWRNISIDLSAFAGSNIQVQVVFDTIDGVNNAFAGFYLDDVNVYCGILPTASPTPSVSPTTSPSSSPSPSPSPSPTPNKVKVWEMFE